MTEQDPDDRAAIDSALNDAEFPDDERGLTGTDDVAAAATGGPGGQTARDVSYEDDGLPDIADDDHQTAAEAEDPQFAPLPGERANASVDFGTTSFEQSEGESLTGRLERELPDDTPDVRPSEDPDREVGQLEQDTSTSPVSDSGTNRTADDVEATSDVSVGGEGPEEGAMHLTDG